MFFVGLEEGYCRTRSLINPDELSEEVRLAYVGLTRARKRLYLVYTVIVGSSAISGKHAVAYFKSTAERQYGIQRLGQRPF